MRRPLFATRDVTHDPLEYAISRIDITTPFTLHVIFARQPSTLRNACLPGLERYSNPELKPTHTAQAVVKRNSHSPHCGFGGDICCNRINANPGAIWFLLTAGCLRARDPGCTSGPEAPSRTGHAFPGDHTTRSRGERVLSVGWQSRTRVETCADNPPHHLRGGLGGIQASLGDDTTSVEDSDRVPLRLCHPNCKEVTIGHSH